MARTFLTARQRRNTLAAAQFLGLGLWLNMPFAHAGYVDLADAPLQTSSTGVVRPNIMFILDNSGSMDWRSATGTDGTSQYSNTRPDYYASVVNKMYYDPDVTYRPPMLPVWDGALGKYVMQQMPNASTTSTRNDGYYAYTGDTSTTNLATICYVNPATANTPPLPLTSTSNCASTYGGQYTVARQRYSFFHVNVGTGTPSASSSTSYTPQANVSYQRQEIASSTASYTRSTARTDCATAPTCTYTEEFQNFANWWSYYRSRINTTKTALGRVFATLNDQYNVGFSTINRNGSTGNTNGDNFLNVTQFSDTPLTTAPLYKWYNNFYKINPSGGTPLQAALRRVGEYYRTGSMGYTGGTASVDPIQHSCQKNFAILSTDGYWNSNTVTAADLGGSGNWDSTVPSGASYSHLGGVSVYNQTLTQGANWPRPVYDSAPTNLTLSDVATYYWATDLRPGTGGVADNNVISSALDQAIWQHMTTFTIGLGTSGTQAYDPNYLTATSGFFFNVKSGTANWPAPSADQPSTTEDLWHAAVSGGGQYFNAANPTAIETSLQQILNAIIAMNSTSAAATLSSSIITGSNNLAYVSSFNTADWTGNVDAFAINTVNGTFSSTSAWSQTAQGQLDGRTAIAGSPGSYTCSDSRWIATFRPGTGGVPFQWGSISGAQQTSLLTQTTLEYLRGWRCNEVSNGGGFRNRTHLLGDIVNSEVAYLGAPSLRYFDSGYAAFKTANASRSPTLFVGSNDGMLHAFDASNGAERWAYVPNRVMSGLHHLTNSTTFQHKFYVDGTPVLGDVDFDNTTTSPGGGWKTILVGGLRKGGFGFYALDVTNPVATSEADLASKVLWEFPNPSDATHSTVASNVGYSFGNPIIAKWNGKWVVVVTSGHDNGTNTGPTTSSGGDGGGYLFILDAKTGSLLQTVATGTGTASNPSGLSSMGGYVNSFDQDKTLQRIYAGDLNGDLWRFDMTPTPTATRVAILKDPSGVTQPITTVPRLYDIGSTHIVYVTTGRYLSTTDINDTQVQSVWAIKDDLTTANMDMRSMVGTAAGSAVVKQTWISTNPPQTSQTQVDLGQTSAKGWVVDFDSGSPGGPGERATDPTILYDTLVFTSNKPAASACVLGGTSYLYYLDARNGHPLFFNNQPISGQFIGNALATRVVVYQIGGAGYIGFRTGASVTPPVGATGPGCVGAGCQSGSGSANGLVCPTGSICSRPTRDPNANNPSRRVFWREIIQ